METGGWNRTHGREGPAPGDGSERRDGTAKSTALARQAERRARRRTCRIQGVAHGGGAAARRRRRRGSPCQAAAARRRVSRTSFRQVGHAEPGLSECFAPRFIWMRARAR